MTPKAKIFTQSVDSSERWDYSINTNPLLESSETLVSYTLYIPAESALYGLTIEGDHTQVGGVIQNLWITFDETEETVTLPIEVTLTTSTGRIIQRTVGIKIEEL